jgi:hypothetical protein
MKTVTVKTYNDYEESWSFVEDYLALSYYNKLQKCKDAREVVVIDGFTGEVLYWWEEGKVKAACGVIFE